MRLDSNMVSQEPTFEGAPDTNCLRLSFLETEPEADISVNALFKSKIFGGRAVRVKES